MKKVREEAFKHRPKMMMWKKALLVLPVLLSASWMFYLQYGKNVYFGTELLSPVNTRPLMTALILFTLGYVVFLLLMFSDNLHDLIWGWVRH